MRHPDDANALATGVWPARAERGQDGALRLAGVDVRALAREYGTPLVVIDEDEVRERARRIRDAFATVFAPLGAATRVYYAGKAFLCTEVARWVGSEGLHLDVASGGELAVARAAGVDPGLLGFHGNNKSRAEIARGVELGVGAIVLDSVVEIGRVAEAATAAGRVQPVRLRVNSGVHASTHEYLATAREDQKFGIALDAAEQAVALIRAEPSLRFLGLHSHIGSQIFDDAGFGEAARRLLGLHARLRAGGEVPELNLGGGFGIAYTAADDPAPIEEIAAGLARVVGETCAELGIPVPAISIEPGRWIVGTAGVTLYAVGTTKDVEVPLAAPDGEAAAGGGEPARAAGSAIRRYVSVDGGMSDNIRPALYGADYAARVADRASAAEPALVRVVGSHCESGDIVVRAEYLPGDVAPGDLLAVPVTGAYSVSLASTYNYLPRPAVVAVRDGAARVLIRRETLDDLLARDLGAGAHEAPADPTRGAPA
ncbi:MAG: diaminopimelate decarboxylase [Actinomycetales bacterium]|nr:diaminopimelate decarboxylase [Actinomycetales bacterium]